MNLLVGDEIIARTSVTGKKMKGKVLHVNYKAGWYTAEFETEGGKFRESFYLRELTNENKIDGRKRRWQGAWKEDDPDTWLDEWSDKGENDDEQRET